MLLPVRTYEEIDKNMNDWFWRCLAYMIALFSMIMVGTNNAAGKEVRSLTQAGEKERLRHLIPLPKEVKIEKMVRLRASEVALQVPTRIVPALKTATQLLKRMALGKEERSGFVIRLALLSEQQVTSPKDAIGKRLPLLPNKEQAYAITPQADRNGLLILANADQGLLNATRTLIQLLQLPREVHADTELSVPLVNIVDWPDLAERGQWGGNSANDLAWTSQWKLNVVEAGSTDPAIFKQAAELGVKIVPFISHLEQIPIPAEFKNEQDIIRKLDPSKPLPSDYRPGLCMSSPMTRKLIEKWLEARARITGVIDISVWLSEDAAPCFCEQCKGKEPYRLEVEAILGLSQR